MGTAQPIATHTTHLGALYTPTAPLSAPAIATTEVATATTTPETLDISPRKAPLTAKRHFVTVRFDATTTMSGLYDPGAEVSCIRSSNLADLRQAGIPMRRVPGISCRDASGNGMATKDAWQITCSLEGRSITIPFVEVTRMSNAIIIGVNAIDTIGLRVDGRGEFYFTPPGDTPTDVSAMHVTTTKAITVPAHTASLIPILVTPTGTAPLPAQAICTLQGLPSVHDLDPAGRAFAYYKNLSPTPITLARGEWLGQAVPLDDLSLSTALPADLPAFINAADAATDSPPDLTDRLRAAAGRSEPQHAPQILNLLTRFASIISTGKSDLGEATDATHHIRLRDKEPVYRKQFPIPHHHQDLIRASVKDWLKLGVVEPSTSPFNAPIFCVPKKEGQGLRVVLDYRGLNAKSLPDKYSLRTIEECLAEVGNANSRIFSTLDLTSGFWQMNLAPDSRPYTAFTIPGVGQFQWKRAAMGLHGCPASFARMMDRIMTGMPNVTCYIDASSSIHRISAHTSNTWSKHYSA